MIRRHGKSLIGEEILKRMTTLLIDTKHDDPEYMREYMKINRKREKLEANILDPLIRDAEKIFNGYKELLEGSE